VAGKIVFELTCNGASLPLRRLYNAETQKTIIVHVYIHNFPSVKVLSVQQSYRQPISIQNAKLSA